MVLGMKDKGERIQKKRIAEHFNDVNTYKIKGVLNKIVYK